MKRALLPLAFALLVAGCGFHLRGQVVADEALRTVALHDATPPVASSNWQDAGHAELHEALARAFRDGGFAVADQAPVTVELLGEKVQRKIASIDASASAAEYQVDYSLRFAIKAADGATLVPETTLAADRSYRYHDNAVMGSAEEESLIYREMRRDAAAQVVRQYRRALAHRPAAAAPAGTPSDAAAP